VKVDQEMTLTQFHQKYPSTVKIEVVALINGLDGPDATLRPGRQYKRVVPGK
jgi:hypothetical protein